MKERIAQIIQKEDMTAAQFAEKIGISPSSLSHILSGRNNPSLEVVMKIHKAYNECYCLNQHPFPFVLHHRVTSLS